MTDKNELDDKIIGVYDSDPRYSEYHNLENIPKHVTAELKHFFETYKELQSQGEKVTVPEVLDREHAWEDIEMSEEKYRNYRKSLIQKSPFRNLKTKSRRY
jgi:inorganic pyrophosphatase